MQTSSEFTEIQQFYKDSTVLLTGATGFIGKLFLEKVLRALPVEKVYILVRTKKNVTASQRFKIIFESPLFDVLKRTNPTALKKVHIIEGDCSLPLLGLSEQGQRTIIDEVDVVFHCAATVKFNEKLKKATYTNVRATKDLVHLAKKAKKLKTFVYVGTAFSNSNRREISEQVYSSKISAEKLIALCESLDDNNIDVITDQLIYDWPNTYTFTKQVTEDYISREATTIPICVARPTIVISTLKEPIAGFVDSFYTLAGFLLTYIIGLNRIMYYKPTNTDLVPADYVINQCIAAGWFTGKSFTSEERSIPVYHCSSALDNPISQDNVYSLIDYYGRQISSTKLQMYVLYFRTTCKYNYLFWRFFFHTIPGYIMDLIRRMQGKKPMYAELVKKLHEFQAVYEHFTTNNFYFETKNTHKLLSRMSFKDKKLFEFDIRNVNWEDFFVIYLKGMRIFLLKDPMDTMEEGFKRYIYLRKIFIITMICLAIILYGLGKILLFRILPYIFGLVITLLGVFCNIICSCT